MAALQRFCTMVVKVLCVPLHLAEVVGLNRLFKYVFPFLMHRISARYNRKMHDRKKELFAALPEFGRPGGGLTILEIGSGTGANFQFYPQGCRVICTDKSPHFEAYLRRSAGEHQHISCGPLVVAAGEDLGSFGDASVDVVVCTLVLCSVSDGPQTLREVIRVLKPGGAFFFLEHVVADPSSWTYFFQHVLQPLWYYLGDGCHITRATWKHLESAGFSDLQLRHITAPLFFLIKPHIVGYAIK